MNEYQKFLVKMLGEKINKVFEKLGKKKIDTSNTMEVMSNMDALYEEVDVLEFGEPTGEKYRFMTKEDKLMLLRIISLTASIDTTCEWAKVRVSQSDDTEVSVLKASASLKFDRNDTNPVATYHKTWIADRLMEVPIDQASIEDRSNAENLARGLCETRCLSKFGIGQWFGEADPEKDLSKLDNASGAIADIAMPDTPAINTPLTDTIADETPAPEPVKVAEPVAEKTEDVSEVTNPVSEVTKSSEAEIPFEDLASEQLTITFPAPTNSDVKEVVKDSTPEPATEKKPRHKKSEAASAQQETAEPVTTSTATVTINMSLEEAREVKATIGLAASNGYTLGYLADNERMKRTNLRYIYTHSNNAREKAAIRVLALNDEEIKASFDGEGISLD